MNHEEHCNPRFETTPGKSDDQDLQSAACWWMKIVAASPGGNTNLSTGVLSDAVGNVIGQRNYSIRSLVTHTVGSVIMVTKPAGGTDSEYNSKLVAFQEIASSAPPQCFQIRSYDAPGAGNAPTWAWCVPYNVVASTAIGSTQVRVRLAIAHNPGSGSGTGELFYACQPPGGTSLIDSSVSPPVRVMWQELGNQGAVFGAYVNASYELYTLDGFAQLTIANGFSLYNYPTTYPKSGYVHAIINRDQWAVLSFCNPG